jgi:hypothetical protein
VFLACDVDSTGEIGNADMNLPSSGPSWLALYFEKRECDTFIMSASLQDCPVEEQAMCIPTFVVRQCQNYGRTAVYCGRE